MKKQIITAISIVSVSVVPAMAQEKALSTTEKLKQAQAELEQARAAQAALAEKSVVQTKEVSGGEDRKAMMQKKLAAKREAMAKKHGEGEQCEKSGRELTAAQKMALQKKMAAKRAELAAMSDEERQAAIAAKKAEMEKRKAAGGGKEHCEKEAAERDARMSKLTPEQKKAIMAKMAQKREAWKEAHGGDRAEMMAKRKAEMEKRAEAGGRPTPGGDVEKCDKAEHGKPKMSPKGRPAARPAGAGRGAVKKR